MNTEAEITRIEMRKDSSSAYYPSIVDLSIDGKPYKRINFDYKGKYKPEQYCTVAREVENFDTSLTVLSSMSCKDMEIFNLPKDPFKHIAMEMLIKEVMANYTSMKKPFDNDFKRAFFATVIDIAYRVDYLSKHHNAFIINSDAGQIDYDEHNRIYLRSDTTIEELGYDTAGFESVFEYCNLDRDIIIFTLNEELHPEGRHAIIIIINLKEDD